jgi:hypothetical protein
VRLEGRHRLAWLAVLDGLVDAAVFPMDFQHPGVLAGSLEAQQQHTVKNLIQQPGQVAVVRTLGQQTVEAII